jgi:hypothetical protein
MVVTFITNHSMEPFKTNTYLKSYLDNPWENDPNSTPFPKHNNKELTLEVK